MRYLFMCKSLTYAQRAARLLEKSGIFGAVIRSPKDFSARGCGYCVAVKITNGRTAAELLRKAELLQGKIYLQESDNTFREVQL